MTVSRWKVMAGVLGVSLGGLAAIAGPCPKPGETHRAAENPPAQADAPKVPPAGPAVPPPAADLAPAPAKGAAPKLPDLPAVKPEPQKPDLGPLPGPMPTKADVPPAGPTVPPILSAPAGGPTPPVGPSVMPPAVQVEAFGQVPSAPSPTQPAAPLVVPQAAPTAGSPLPVLEPAVKPAAAVVAAPAAAKFRIILRVGEGEPTFEVRTGDDLMMKVVCEKVDVKSPDKGQGPSAVRAAGKVRFVGFGAEGTCDELSFLAGTGEVMMAGRVKVQVKDKLGRVESEIASDKLNYKLDAGSMPVGIKP
jgi:hypothetical protein